MLQLYFKGSETAEQHSRERHLQEEKVTATFLPNILRGNAPVLLCNDAVSKKVPEIKAGVPGYLPFLCLVTSTEKE